MYFNFGIFLCLCILKLSLGANILVLESVPSPSHHIWIRTLTVELAARGHNVTSLSADIDSVPTKNLHYLHLDAIYPLIFNGTEETDFIKNGEMSHYLAFLYFYDYAMGSCIGTHKSIGFQQLLHYPDDFKFDLVLYDFIFQPCALGFLHKFKYPPLMALTAFYSIYTTAPLAGSMYYTYLPHFLQNKHTESFLGRVESFIICIMDKLYKDFIIFPQFDKMSANFFPEVPNVSKLEKLTKLSLINYDPILETGEPILPNVIPVGGLQIPIPKELPSDLKLIADNAKNSLILFSMGTNVRSDKLGDARLIHILKAFKSLPQYTFLWKFESDKLPMEVPKNVIIRAWIPQPDVLAHPNTILFITHSGLLSTQEAAWFGVPMLGLPIFADQFINVEKVIRKGVAEKLFIQNLSDKTLANSVLSIVTNPKYRENMKKLSNSFRDQPETPLQRAVWWTEWLLRNPDTNSFRNPTLDMNFFQRQMIDVIGFFTIITFIILLISIKITIILTKCLFSHNKTSQKKKQKTK